MILNSLTIDGYKSFRKKAELPISSRTTILIGPNDHGKTNALMAIEKLNPDNLFTPLEINDRLRNKEHASITFSLGLHKSEIDSLYDANRSSMRPDDGTIIVQSTASRDFMTVVDILAASGTIEAVARVERPLSFPLLDELTENLRAEFSSILRAILPKVVFFRSETLRQTADAVNSSTLEQNEVMQGVFRLAGIWEERERLLSGNTRTNNEDLREASKLLTKKIRENWTQGRDLEFFLEYVGNDIRLTIKDTAKTVTPLAERSEGFTSYFAMRMLLVARTQLARPNGYIFMFDEPGLNLHPKGQVDLQNVFEDIAQTNQIVYSTHSVFLINKNHPDRNHLIFKNEEGSNVDKKPFVGGWAKVKEHLGLYLSANFLFSDKILLAEGATDEIYVPLIVQGLIGRGQFDGDLNALAIHSSLNESEMISSAGIYLREQRQPAILVDGDGEGDKRKTKIERWSKRINRKCPVINLSDYKDAPCSIEDFLEPTTFKEAVVAACEQAIEEGVIEAKYQDWGTRLQERLQGKDGKTSGKRLQEALEELFGEAISDVWIARKYSAMIQNNNPNTANYWKEKPILNLVKGIWTALELPKREDLAPFA